MATDTLQLSAEDIELIKDQDLCAKSFMHFLRYVRIENPTKSKVVPFEPWPHLIEIAEALEAGESIIVLKARQIGLSWIIAAFNLWRVLFHYHNVVIEFSQGEDEAKKLLRKSAFIYANLPAHLQLKPKANSSTILEIESTGSTIEPYASTQHGGRSVTASVYCCDEHAFHPYAVENYTAAKPTVDAGGQMIFVSTNDKKKVNSLFKSLYLDAKEGKNSLRPFFFNVWSRPGRDQAWYDKVKADVPETVLVEMGLSRETFMEQEYPRTEEEALSPSQEMAAFDQHALAAMQEECKPPIRVEVGLSFDLINIYQEYAIGKAYCAFTDTSHGVGLDYSTTPIMDARTGYIVADILDNRISPEQLAAISIEMLKLYQCPLWGIEDNEWGAVTISKANDLGYPNLFYKEWQKAGKRTSDPLEKLHVGWHTGTSKIHPDRLLLWGEVIPATNNRQITIPNRQGLRQFYDVIRTMEGRIEAMSGGHDDYPLAVGGCWQMRKYVDFGSNARVGRRKSSNPFN